MRRNKTIILSALTLALALALALTCLAGWTAAPSPAARVLPAIEEHETRGIAADAKAKALGDYASDRNGNGIKDAPDYDAWGILQIHPVMVKDINRITGKRGEKFTDADRFNPEKSRRMFHIYAQHYSKGADEQTIARRWNGGPTGDDKDATLGYWASVKEIMKNLDP